MVFPSAKNSGDRKLMVVPVMILIKIYFSFDLIHKTDYLFELRYMKKYTFTINTVTIITGKLNTVYKKNLILQNVSTS